jgi:hypothetical protein
MFVEGPFWSDHGKLFEGSLLSQKQALKLVGGLLFEPENRPMLLPPARGAIGRFDEVGD